MRIIPLLDGAGADELLRKLGFVTDAGEVLAPRRPPEAHRVRAIRGLSSMVTETIALLGEDVGPIDVVVGAGYSNFGLTAALTANIAHDTQNVRSRCGAHIPYIPNVMLCRNGLSGEERRGKLTPYGDDGRQMDGPAIQRAIAGKRMLFVCLSAEEGALVFHAMRSAIHEKNQGGKRFSVTHKLLAGIVAPVVRDEPSRLEAYYHRVVGVTPPIFTLKTLGLPPRQRPPGKSGVHAVFAEPTK